jgi:hypothetical protein
MMPYHRIIGCAVCIALALRCLLGFGRNPPGWWATICEWKDGED